MLNKASVKTFGRKKSKLDNTAGEIVRDQIIEASIKAAERTAYSVGNQTDSIIGIAEKAKNAIDGGTVLAGGGESASALGRIAFKASRDIARGDSVCTGLCIVSGTCEAIALSCSTMRFIPGRGRIYVGAKIVSRGCIAFRNSCAGEGC